METKIIFHQLFEKESSTYTYLLGDPVTKEAVIIDPVIETVERDLKLISELGLKLKLILDTHVHADHITGSGELRNRTGAKIGISSAYDMSLADLHLNDGDNLNFGEHSIKVWHTPGHTSGCLTFQSGDKIFTGDALLVRGCGRTDFQEGSSDKLFHSVRDKIFHFPDTATVYPAHDYKGFTKTSILEEKTFNPRLNLKVTKEEFVHIMANLNLAYPKKINEAVPANLVCGLHGQNYSQEFSGEVTTIKPEVLQHRIGQIKLIDVRGSDEFNSELGHIRSAQLVTLGDQLDSCLKNFDKENEIVFVCRSGRRSGEATKQALKLGFKKVWNLEGGMLRWNELQYPVVKDMGGS